MNGQKPTDRQQAVLDYMRWHLVEYQRLPTIREIAAELGIRSPNGVVCHIRALARRGLISQWPHSRAMNYRLNGVRIRLEDQRAEEEATAKSSRCRNLATDEKLLEDIEDAFHERSCATA